MQFYDTNISRPWVEHFLPEMQRISIMAGGTSEEGDQRFSPAKRAARTGSNALIILLAHMANTYCCYPKPSSIAQETSA